jgi:SAM-dependent methyltransferase
VKSYADVPGAVCRARRSNQETPFSGILVPTDRGLAHTLGRILARLLSVPCQVISKTRGEAAKTLNPLLAASPDGYRAAVEHYADPDAWKVSTIDANPFYIRELAIAETLVARQHWRSALDLGAGFGRATRRLQAYAENFVLIDGSEAMLRVAASLGASKEIVLGTLDDHWPFASHCFDLVVGLQIINHSSDLNQFFTELRRVLVDEGEALLSIGNRWSLKHLLTYRRAHFPTAGFRRLSFSEVQECAARAGIHAALVGGAGLFSPLGRLVTMEFLNCCAATYALSHLMLVRCRVIPQAST